MENEIQTCVDCLHRMTLGNELDIRRCVDFLSSDILEKIGKQFIWLEIMNKSEVNFSFHDSIGYSLDAFIAISIVLRNIYALWGKKNFHFRLPYIFSPHVFSPTYYPQKKNNRKKTNIKSKSTQLIRPIQKLNWKQYIYNKWTWDCNGSHDSTIFLKYFCLLRIIFFHFLFSVYEFYCFQVTEQEENIFFIFLSFIYYNSFALALIPDAIELNRWFFCFIFMLSEWTMRNAIVSHG